MSHAESLFREVERTREVWLATLSPDAKKKYDAAVDAWCAAAVADLRRSLRGQRGAA